MRLKAAYKQSMVPNNNILLLWGYNTLPRLASHCPRRCVGLCCRVDRRGAAAAGV
jgi:hypothetical protein